MRSRKFQNPPP